jgi:hypothetical protein
MKRSKILVSWLVLLVFARASAAADLRVRVFERGASKPLSGVAVCLGTQARADQFGSKSTDASGYVVFDSLPQAQLLVTAAKPGFKGEQEVLVTSSSNRMLVLSLASGGGGPDCSAATLSSGAASGGLQVLRFALNGGAGKTASRRVTLDHSLSGPVTQYRASEKSDFSDTDWQAYTAAPSFELSTGDGKKRVYFQVRRHSSANGAVVESLSPVVSAAIVLGGG